MPLTMRADSTEYLTATVAADHDLTGVVIEVAIPMSNTAPTTWYPAQVLSVTPFGDKWIATYRIFIGPAGGVTQLSQGSYDWTVRITDDPEVPIRKAGVVTVTLT